MAEHGDTQYRILGAFEVWRGDQRLTPTALKQRLLLAVLVCHAGTVVTTEQLVNELWETDPPSTARALIAGYVAKLRKQLGDHSLVTWGSGYRLADGQLDAECFDQLCEQGWAAQRRQAYEEAAELLGRALALWKAPVLVDLPATPTVQATRARLEARHMTAAESWAAAELENGRHRELVAELEPLVAAHPLQEGLRHHLMVALYRSGRQADALASYRELRRQLVEELGVEPGQHLQHLHQRMLAGDPHLCEAESTGKPRPPRPAPSPPRQLPPDLSSFTARGPELARLRQQLQPAVDGAAAVVAAVHGPAGVGKSALVVHLAHQVANQFPDGTLYADLHGATGAPRPITPHVALSRFLRDLGVPDSSIPTELDEAIATYRSVLATRRALIVADDAVDAAQVRPLLPASPGSAMLVTSRTALATIEGALHLPLEVLAVDEAVQLLRHLAGPDRVDADPAAAEEVACACGGLPLAIRVAGAKLAARPAWTMRVLADRLADQQRRLDELAHADIEVRSGFQVSYRELQAGSDPVEQRAAQVFALLGVLEVPDVGAAVVASLADLPVGHSEAALERLVDAQLVATPDSGRYRLHDLLRLYARETAATVPRPQRNAALDRALAHYLASARRAGRMLFPAEPRTAGTSQQGQSFADPAAAQDWLERERLNLLAAAHQAASAPDTAGYAVALGAALFRFLDTAGDWHLLRDLADLALAAAQQTDDPAALAQAYNDLGAAHVRLRHCAAAVPVLQAGLRIRRRHGDQHGQAATLNNLGNAYRGLQRLAEAAECFAGSLAIRRAIGDRHGEARALDNLATIHQQRGEHERSIACRLESLTIARDLGDQQLAGLVLVNLAQSRLAAGVPGAAVSPARQSVAICRRAGNRYGEAIAWWALGDAELALGRHGPAREAWQCAASILERLANPAVDELRTLLDSIETPSRLRSASTHPS